MQRSLVAIYCQQGTRDIYIYVQLLYHFFNSYVIHTVGPIGENAPALTSCYDSVLRVVELFSIKSVAFCGVSTGVYGYPLGKACKIALGRIRAWLEAPEHRDSVDLIVFCTFTEREHLKVRDLFCCIFFLIDLPRFSTKNGCPDISLPLLNLLQTTMRTITLIQPMIRALLLNSRPAEIYICLDIYYVHIIFSEVRRSCLNGGF